MAKKYVESLEFESRIYFTGSNQFFLVYVSWCLYWETKLVLDMSTPYLKKHAKFSLLQCLDALLVKETIFMSMYVYVYIYMFICVNMNICIYKYMQIRTL